MPELLDPTLSALAAGALLHDVGKFMQRAHAPGDLERLHPTSAGAENTFCPVFDGRYSHRHVLWSDAFFDWLVDTVGAPDGLDLRLAQKLAASHHRPEAAGKHEALARAVAEGDRLSAGMDRRTPEEGDPRRRNHRRQPMLSPLAAIDIGRGAPASRVHALGRLEPGVDHLYPRDEIDDVARGLPDQYRNLWQEFCEDFRALGSRREARHFLAGVQGLLEVYTWAIPSSTVDCPDISLYDHSLGTAAIACALWAYHSENGDPSLSAVTDRNIPAYRLVAGDLSGIQRSLFTMAAQGARAVAKVLRARSFLMGQAVEAAALLVLDAFGLPDVCRVQSAGGRFMILAPAVPDFDDRIQRVREMLDAWFYERYLGGLALNIAASPAFCGDRFVGERFLAVLDALGSAVEDAKHRPLSTVATGPIPVVFPQGACTVCAMRPARSGEDRVCGPCSEEQRVGQRLPRAEVLLTGPVDRFPRGAAIPLPGGLGLDLVSAADCPADLGGLWRAVLIGEETRVPLPRAWVARYVPAWEDGEWRDPVYDRGRRDDEDEAPRAGRIKTFHHLASLAREADPDGLIRGRALLAVLKADVDDLGLVFSSGLPRERQSLSRYAGLSRMLEFFFSAHLPRVMEQSFPHTYTVYAGGDDLLLIGPWRQTLDLAKALRETFARFSGDNPNLTLSAAHLLTPPDVSLARSAAEADDALDASKQGRKNQVWVLGGVLAWDDLSRAGLVAEKLVRWVDGKVVTRGFVQRLHRYARMRRAAERDPAQAAWRAHLAYDLKRNFKGRATDRADILELVGLGPDLRDRGATLAVLPVAVQWALHRLRT